MAQISSVMETNQPLIDCNEEIQLQNMLIDQIVNAAIQVSDHVTEMNARDLEYEDVLAQCNLYLKLIQTEKDEQKDLKAVIAEIKKELDGSSYVEEIKTHDMLENLADQRSKNLSTKFCKKLSKEQFADFQEKRKKLEREKTNSFRLHKLTEELKIAQLEHRELVAIQDQKKKRHENLKKTYDDVKTRRAKLLARKDELEQELKELEKEDTTEDDESSDDEFNIIINVT